MNIIQRFRRWLGVIAAFEFERIEQFNAESVERFITRVEKLHLEPGDGIVITTTRSLSAKHVDDIKRYLQAYLEKVTQQKHPVFVMDGDMGMKVVSGKSTAPEIES